MENTAKVLADHPFFEGLDAQLIEIISSCAKDAGFTSGQTIYKEGDDAEQFLLIRDGKVAIEVFSPGRGSHIIQTIGPGDVLGWSWFFPPFKRRFDARAVETTTAIVLDGKYLREKAEQDHRLGYELLKRFSMVVVERLQAMRLQLLDIYGKRS